MRKRKKSAKKHKYSHVFLIPWLIKGGADLISLNFMNALAGELRNNICVIITEDVYSPWLKRVPKSAKVIQFGRISRYENDEEKKIRLLKILSALKPSVIHNINSGIGWQLFAEHGAQLSRMSSLYVSSFCEDYDKDMNRMDYAFRFLDKIIPFVRKVFIENDRNTSELKDKYPEYKEKFTIIYTPVKIVGKKERRNIGTVLWAGRMDRQKRPDILIKIAKSLPDIKFLVYGKECLNTENNYISQIKFCPNIKLIKERSYFMQYLRENTAKIGMLLYTSQWDGHPIVILEAFAAGIPVIAPDVGSIKEVVNNETGFLIKSFDDIQEYCRIIKGLSSGEINPESKIKSALELVAKRHSWKKFADTIQQEKEYISGKKEYSPKIEQKQPLKISVVIPTLNPGESIYAAIDSVEKCPENIYEIIIVNDGSFKTESLEIISDLKAKGYKIIDKKHQGLASARNTGVNAARGKYILTLDDDDYINPNYLKKGREIMDTNPDIGVVYGDVEYFGRKTGRKAIVKEEFENIWRENCIGACAVFKKKMWADIGGFDENMEAYEDWEFWISALEKGWKFHHITEVMFYYCKRPQSLLSFCSKPENHKKLLEYIIRKHPKYYADKIIESVLDENYNGRGNNMGSLQPKLSPVIGKPDAKREIIGKITSLFAKRKKILYYSIDSINERYDGKKRFIILSEKLPINIYIRGWVVSPELSSLAEKVIFCVNGREYEAEYGLRRRDVADYFGNNALCNSGFSCEIDNKEFLYGIHTGRIKIKLFGREEAVFLPWKIKIITFPPFGEYFLGILYGLKNIFLYKIEKEKIIKAFYFARCYGILKLLKKVVNSAGLKEKLSETELYDLWVKKTAVTISELEKQRNANFIYRPLISIITPVFNSPEKYLLELTDSIKNQTYPNWEWCIADGGNDSGVKKILKELSKGDRRIKVKYLSNNKGIALNTNEAVSLSSGEYVVFVDHDDIIPANALYEIVKKLNNDPSADLIYSDEDKITSSGKRMHVFFKPDFAPDTFRSQNYLCHLMAVRKSLGDKLRWFKPGYEGSQDYEFILRVIENTSKIVHIPKVLYHWRIWENSLSCNGESKPDAVLSARKALQEHVKRSGLKGKVDYGLFKGSYQVKYNIDKEPLVSIIIPNRDHAEDLERCIDSILTRSTYGKYEILVIENGSVENKTFDYYRTLENKNHIKVYCWEKPFNYSSINNWAAQLAGGEILLFLNNDTEVISSDWIERMLEHAQRKEIGAVGAKLLYSEGKIQHAGVIIGMGSSGVAGHCYCGEDAGITGHHGRLKIIHNVSCVTGACLMMRKEMFKDLGGFDERFVSDYNDIDLCMRIRKKGYLIVMTPFSVLYHRESGTRGNMLRYDRVLRHKEERELFKKIWKRELLETDPYFNPNLSPDRADFVPKI